MWREAIERTEEVHRKISERATKIAKADEEGFKSLGEWEKVVCGEKNFIRDSRREHWKKQGYSRKRSDSLEDENPDVKGRITRSDFPIYYHFEGKANDGEIVVNAMQYSYTCHMQDSKVAKYYR